MDSRLLNAFHDDPYECYESHITDVWTTNNIEMELEHTLDGILPIRATEVGNETYCNLYYPDEHIFGVKENNSNALVYNDFEVQQLSAEERVGTTELHSNAIEVVNVYDAANIIQDNDNDDARSQYSNTSFRTRTDSSSIGDYESHSSDYDDDDDDDDDDIESDYDNNEEVHELQEDEVDAVFDNSAIEALEADDLLTDLPGLHLLSNEHFMFSANGVKQRTISTNTIGSDVDAANFDLAEFITKDDDILAKATVAASTKKVPTTNKIIQSHSKQDTITKITKFEPENGADSDSDVIVDVETVEIEDSRKRVLLLKHNAVTDMPDDTIAFVDNVKADPEWNPKEIKSKCNKPIGSMPTAKKMCELTKGGKLKRLNTPTQHISKTAIANKKQILKSTQTNVQNSAAHRHGIGKGGKNLALLKRDCESIEATSNCAEAKTKGKDIALFKHDSHSIDVNKQNNNNKNNNTSNINNNNNKNINNNVDNNVKAKPNVETEKRKLNLDEYKRRLAGEDLNNANKPKSNQVKTKATTATTTTTAQTQTQTPINKLPTTVKPLNLSPTKTNKPHSEAVTSIVKTLKEQQHNQTINEKIDPITLARNKVLRMQELKRAQQMKIIDSTISAKVPRVTKLLPLQEIIKDTAYAIKPEKDEKTNGNGSTYDNHPDYERIVMVSVACNTALTFSSNDVLPNVPLLENISRVTADQVKISHNSLITSIQDAVVKQSIPKITAPVDNVNDALKTAEQQQHGEDKIIMHLRKDRMREHITRSIEIQTDFQAAFPTLPLPKYLRKLRHSRRKYRKNDATTSKSMSASSGMESSESDDENFKANKRNADCAADYQNSEFNVGGTGSIGGYSSRSSRRHRSSVSSSYSESGHQRPSRDPKRKSTNYRKSMHKKSRSSSSSSASSLSDYSDRSRSRGRRSRSRSRSPFYGNSNARRESNYVDRNVSKPAVEERRIVYVGRIEEETSKEMLRRKFIAYGSIRQITVHYKENGMKYGFVTFERSEDAFAVIDNSARDSQINMYDISFGGRRAFCRTSYADLDNAGINNYHSYVFPKVTAPPKQEDSFEALLKKMKAKLDANKPSQAASSSTTNDKL